MCISYRKYEILIEDRIEAILDNLSLNNLVAAWEEKDPDVGITLTKERHLLEITALNHCDIEAAGVIVITNLVVDFS